VATFNVLVREIADSFRGRPCPASMPGGQRWLEDHPPGITHVGLVARVTGDKSEFGISIGKSRG
jgi:hypothetical protein